ncbi:MAG: hypothetical protein HND53_01125 [Proteobacteria bacterium]|nr:hypothetical protein [Pseudomonadota bacterium]NOG59074.1 hypothetical protein [Pseudomonadota bacterium]
MGLKAPTIIFECANAHGGDFDILISTINEFAKITYPHLHIKFQPLKADTISLRDFAWYETYKELEYSKKQWMEIISEASNKYDGVWLDIFDVFGIEILNDNFRKLTGIKLQASVLLNYEVISSLQNLCLYDKDMIINVSGYEISEIESILNEISILNVRKLILQIGFQSYPTSIEDTALRKIQILRSAFPYNEICLADHLSATDDLACVIPLMGVASGCDYVEKHICIDRKHSKYDYHSSLEPGEMQLLVSRLEASREIIGSKFISKAEKKYLADSIQIPIAGKELPKDTLVSRSDVIYRRTKQNGITFNDVLEKQNKHYILSENVNEGSALTINSFRSARIGVIVACRMKSSRLKKKAILPIDGIPSVERCLTNCLNISSADVVVLATSTIDEDDELKKYTLDGKVECFQGDPDDVIKRYIDVCDTYNIDVIIRVTADCPIISYEIAETLLDHHFAAGADYTAARDCAVGTACEIYNAEALRRVIGYLGEAKYSEYMTWYLQNNKDIFKVELVDLPDEMVRNYRLTLDYPEDLEFFEKLFEELKDASKKPTLENVFKILDKTASIVNINSHIKLKYKSDTALIELLNQETKIK